MPELSAKQLKASPADVRKALSAKFAKLAGPLSDQVYVLREMEAFTNKLSEALKSKRHAGEVELLAVLNKSKQEGAKGKVGRAEIENHDFAVVEDWDALYKHITKTKSWELLQKRLSSPAINERRAAKKRVPGVSYQTVRRVKVLKAR